jgi:hypothetical protein
MGRAEGMASEAGDDFTDAELEEFLSTPMVIVPADPVDPDDPFNCKKHQDMKPDEPCTCFLCQSRPEFTGGKAACEYRDHDDCEACQGHAARCPPFAAWFAARNRPADPEPRGKG